MTARLARAVHALWTAPVRAFALGLSAALGQAPFGLWPLAVAAFFGLTWLVTHAPGPRRAALIAWAGGAGHFALALSWIVEPFLVDIRTHGWMAPFAIVAMAGGLALFWGLAGGFAGWAGQGVRRRALAFAVALAAVELARGYVLTGFAWALPGHIWIGAPQMQLGALAGPVGLTLLTTFAAALPLILPLGPGRAAGAVMAALMVTGAGLWGALRLEMPMPPDADPPHIRLIQPNAAQHLKWRRDMIPVFWERQLAFTAAPAEQPPDLIIWPETAVPWLLNDAGGALERIADAAGDVPVMLGIQRREDARFYNSLAVLDPGGAVSRVYDKHHLVPFGEYIPLGPVLGRLGIKGLAARDSYGYAAGPGPTVLDLGTRLGTALPLICYEAVFPQDLRGPERPRWLVQITNDAWFGDRTGPYQHLALARLRAVEQGLPLVRAANTGVSAVIDARGRITHSLALNTAGHVTAPLPPALPPTPYAGMGDMPAALALAAMLAALVAVRRRK
ncbi:apolipoprotein N-acyltransferase [Rhodovulum euryhalinum]|uniref:Apolipoprotein N-acyltransferase n=1 Tax=Rhodovulum euryhalinum TaxID=35805 RepID=A0A4R2KG68_9RHOB|nr:apolipoprotein N-acyltransferase [Rhodovulum euryhalinum]TCO72094.1 apolipoprotein N-acyltransferase [Rhodovulum euryhalinum]